MEIKDGNGNYDSYTPTLEFRVLLDGYLAVQTVRETVHVNQCPPFPEQVEPEMGGTLVLQQNKAAGELFHSTHRGYSRNLGRHCIR